MSTRLPAYLEQKAQALRATAVAAREDPGGTDPQAWRATLSSTAVADDLTGVRKTQVGRFSLIVDAGPQVGGFDLAPSSPELLLAALSSCLTHTVLLQAAGAGLPIERVSTDVEATLWTGHVAGIDSDDPIGPRDFRATIAIEAPAATETDLAALRDAVRAACLILHTLRRANDVTVTFAGLVG
jgi:uncharacterized OsmC-like protein